MENNTSNNLKYTAVAVLAVLAVVMFLPKEDKFSYKNLSVFAQCLSDKGAKMYGAYWCSHCKAQKALFGGSFKYINYIECTDRPNECNAVGITGYPTWQIASTTLAGEQSLEELAEASECALERK